MIGIVLEAMEVFASTGAVVADAALSAIGKRDLIETAAADVRRLRGESDAGPFSPKMYSSNAAEGVEWEARMAVRKALTRVQAGRPAEALTILDLAAQRLPDGSNRAAVEGLAARLRAEVGAGGADATKA